MRALQTFTTSPTTATTIAGVKFTGTGQMRRDRLCAPAEIAIPDKSSADVYPPSALSFPVPKLIRVRMKLLRQATCTSSARPIASAWEDMCQPSAASAIDPVQYPAMSSRVMVATVRSRTCRVATSRSGAGGAPDSWISRRISSSRGCIGVLVDHDSFRPGGEARRRIRAIAATVLREPVPRLVPAEWCQKHGGFFSESRFLADRRACDVQPASDIEPEIWLGQL